VTSVDDDEPNDDSHDSEFIDEESGEDPEAKSAVKVARSSKHGGAKIAAKLATQRARLRPAPKKKAGKWR
jgi:hypothetical protein